MTTPFLERLQQAQPVQPVVPATPSIEEATVFVRLFLEHTAEMQGHDLLPWNYSAHGVASSACQLCGAEAQVFYRANREPRYTHQLRDRCPAQTVRQFAS